MYKANQAPFSETLFQNPTREYRGAPFWSWNGKLKVEELDAQMQTFREMGFGGFHIHSRIGLETEYLGDDFLELVQHCNQHGDQLGLLTWLYDEDKWPSGAGGGRVTSDTHFASRYLLFTPTHYPEGFLKRNVVQTSRLSKNGHIKLLCRYSVTLEAGKLKAYHRLSGEETGNDIWYAYLVVTEKLPWFNNQPYVDALNPEAVQRFIEVTHERYARSVGNQFSKTIPAIFTDEPTYHKQENMADGQLPQDVGVVYTDGMEEYFQSRYGHSLLHSLPELFWERADGIISQIRYEYYDCVAWMFSNAYSKTLGDWCNAHGLLLTGHVLFEDKLDTQTRVAGEVMRVLRHFSLPGIDMLADHHEYTTAKQAQSISRQYGRSGVTSELYGVTNWDFDFRGHKHQGDWQAALGVTTRVPHLAWMSMGGESKRDYPAPIDSHSPWYQKYNILENHFARVNVAMTRGKPCCRIAVIHPIESFWMRMGPDIDTIQERDQLEQHFQELTQWLLFNLLDFDYVSEALLPEQYIPSEDKKMHLGQMSYDVILLPGLITLRKSTLEALQHFSVNGGKVLFLGPPPTYVDAIPSDRVVSFSQDCCTISFDKASLLPVLEPYRDVDITSPDFRRSERLIYQLRQESECSWLFIASGRHDDRKETNHWLTQTGREDFTVRIRGIYSVQRCDTMSGQILDEPAAHKDGWTLIHFSAYAHDSLLLRLQPTKPISDVLPLPTERIVLSECYLPTVVDYTLSEPNVLTLDQAEYRLDGGTWQPKEEVLRLDNKVRQQCGYGLRTESFPQPWLEPAKPIEHSIELRFSIMSEIELASVDLAFEGSNQVSLTWNGAPVATTGQKYYIDKAIRVESLGPVQAGKNILQIGFPFGSGVNLEWCYILGNFGVQIEGDHSILTKQPRQISFGDLSRQRFPFYGGNLSYHCEIETHGGDIELEIPEYYGALLNVELDKHSQDVFMEPYRAVFTQVPAGKHRLSITLYGTRINTFGQIHNCNRKETYYGPKTWRTNEKNWTYLYQLHTIGITVVPILREIHQKILV